MAEKKKKASMYVGEKVLSNPKGVKPEWDKDTDVAPDITPQKTESGPTPGGGHYSTKNAESGAARYNTKNPEGNTVEADTVRSFKTGTPYVPRTGFYKLHEGEAVIPKEKNMNPFDKITAGDKKPRKAIKAIHVHATDNGRHVVTHEHHHPEHHKDAVHAMNSVDELKQHMADNASKIEPQAPSPDEQEAPAAGGMSAGPAPAPGM